MAGSSEPPARRPSINSRASSAPGSWLASTASYTSSRRRAMPATEPAASSSVTCTALSAAKAWASHAPVRCGPAMYSTRIRSGSCPQGMDAAGDSRRPTVAPLAVLHVHGAQRKGAIGPQIGGGTLPAARAAVNVRRAGLRSGAARGTRGPGTDLADRCWPA